MEGFKSQKKIACFKEGGQVAYKSRKNHAEEKEMSEDIKQDKAIVKKGVAQHEAAKHKGEPKTELKLKTGGRAKKETGTVKKYCSGKSVKKMADGGATIDPTEAQPIGVAPVSSNIKNILKDAGTRLKDNVVGTEKQNTTSKKSLDKVAEGEGVLSSVERGIRSIVGKKRGGKC